MWYRMMGIAFLTNGLGAFGAGTLKHLGLDEYAFLYLAFWFTAGLAVSLAVFLNAQPRLFFREMLIGSLMGLFSSVGWILLVSAMSTGVPNYIALPIAIGGNLSIVALVGVLIFKERLSLYGYLGILSGITGIALLAAI